MRITLLGISRRGGTGEEAGEAVGFHAIRVALDVEDGGAVRQASEAGGGHRRIGAEEMSPAGESLVGGNEGGRLLFLAATDRLEEQRSLFGIESELADFVDDEQLRGGEYLQIMRRAVWAEVVFMRRDRSKEQSLPRSAQPEPGSGRWLDAFRQRQAALEDAVVAFIQKAR